MAIMYFEAKAKYDELQQAIGVVNRLEAQLASLKTTESNYIESLNDMQMQLGQARGKVAELAQSAAQSGVQFQQASQLINQYKDAFGNFDLGKFMEWKGLLNSSLTDFKNFKGGIEEQKNALVRGIEEMSSTVATKISDIASDYKAMENFLAKGDVANASRAMQSVQTGMMDIGNQNAEIEQMQRVLDGIRGTTEAIQPPVVLSQDDLERANELKAKIAELNEEAGRVADVRNNSNGDVDTSRESDYILAQKTMMEQELNSINQKGIETGQILGEGIASKVQIAQEALEKLSAKSEELNNKVTSLGEKVAQATVNFAEEFKKVEDQKDAGKNINEIDTTALNEARVTLQQYTGELNQNNALLIQANAELNSAKETIDSITPPRYFSNEEDYQRAQELQGIIEGYKVDLENLKETGGSPQAINDTYESLVNAKAELDALNAKAEDTASTMRGSLGASASHVQSEIHRITDALEASNARVQEKIDLFDKAKKAVEDARAAEANGTGTSEQTTFAIADMEKARVALADAKSENAGLNHEMTITNQQLTQIEQQAQGGRMRTQMMQAREELAKMIRDGEFMSPQFEQAAEKAGALRRQMTLSSGAMNFYAQPHKNLVALGKGFKTASSAAAAYQGIMGLVASKDEEFAKIQTKIQGALALTMGIQQLMTLTSKKSELFLTAMRLKNWAATKAKTAAEVENTVAVGANAGAETANAVASQASAVAKTEEAAATHSASVAQGIFNAVANANPYVLMITAIVALGAALWGLGELFSSSKRKHEDLVVSYSKGTEEILKQQMALERLITTYSNAPTVSPMFSEAQGQLKSKASSYHLDTSPLEDMTRNEDDGKMEKLIENFSKAEQKYRAMGKAVEEAQNKLAEYSSSRVKENVELFKSAEEDGSGIFEDWDNNRLRKHAEQYGEVYAQIEAEAIQEGMKNGAEKFDPEEVANIISSNWNDYVKKNPDLFTSSDQLSMVQVKDASGEGDKDVTMGESDMFGVTKERMLEAKDMYMALEEAKQKFASADFSEYAIAQLTALKEGMGDASMASRALLGDLLPLNEKFETNYDYGTILSGTYSARELEDAINKIPTDQITEVNRSSMLKAIKTGKDLKTTINNLPQKKELFVLLKILMQFAGEESADASKVKTVKQASEYISGFKEQLDNETDPEKRKILDKKIKEFTQRRVELHREMLKVDASKVMTSQEADDYISAYESMLKDTSIDDKQRGKYASGLKAMKKRKEAIDNAVGLSDSYAKAQEKSNKKAEQKNKQEQKKATEEAKKRKQEASELEKLRERYAKELNKQKRDMDLSVEEESVKQLEEGSNKELRQIDLNYKKELAKIEDWYDKIKEAYLREKEQEWNKSAGTKGMRDKGLNYYSSGQEAKDSKTFDESEEATRATKARIAKEATARMTMARDVMKVFKKYQNEQEVYDDERLERMQRLADMNLAVEEIQNKINEEIAREGGSDEEVLNYLTKQKQELEARYEIARKYAHFEDSRIKSQLNFLSKYGNAQEKIMATEKKYEQEINAMRLDGKSNEWDIKAKEKERDESIAKLNVAKWQEKIDWAGAFKNVGDIFNPLVQESLKGLRELYNSSEFKANANATDKEKVAKLIRETENTLVPTSFTEIFKKNNIAQLLDEYQNAQKNLNIITKRRASKEKEIIEKRQNLNRSEEELYNVENKIKTLEASNDRYEDVNSNTYKEWNRQLQTLLVEKGEIQKDVNSRKQDLAKSEDDFKNNDKYGEAIYQQVQDNYADAQEAVTQAATHTRDAFADLDATLGSFSNVRFTELYNNFIKLRDGLRALREIKIEKLKEKLGSVDVNSDEYKKYSAKISKLDGTDKMEKLQSKIGELQGKTDAKSLKKLSKYNKQLENLKLDKASRGFERISTTSQDVVEAQGGQAVSTTDVSSATQNLAQTTEQTNRTIATLGETTAGGVEVLGKMKEIKVDEGVGKAIGKFGKALESAGVIGQIVGAVLAILDLLKNGIGNLIGGILDAIFNAINGVLGEIFSGDILKNIFQPLGNGLATLFDTISFGGFSSVFGDGKGNQKEVEEREEEIVNEMERLEKALDSLTKKLDESKGGFESIEYATKAMELAQKNQQLASEKLANRMGYTSSHHSNSHYLGKNLSSWGGYEDINKLLGTNIKSTEELYALSSKQMNDIRTYLGEWWDIFKESGEYDWSEYWEDYADMADNVEELTDRMQEKLTSTTFDTIYNNFKSTLKEMTGSVQAFTDNFSELLYDALLNNYISNEFGKQLETLYEDMANAMKDNGGSLSQAQIDAFKETYTNLADQATDYANQLSEITGYDSVASQSGSTNSFGNMSQETAEAMEGRLTALQIATEGIKNKVYEMDFSAPLKTFSQGVSDMTNSIAQTQSILASSLIELQKITDNTGAIVKPIRSMAEDISRIKKNTETL